MQGKAFSSLDIKAELLAGIASLEYKAMTPVQEQALPVILERRDLLAQAKTGSGKTAAFAIGLLNQLQIQAYQTQALVLCPTRELAEQVSVEIRNLARSIANTRVVTLCGGKPMGEQLASLQRSPHVVVGTPGRILKHIEKGSLQLADLQTLVLDEADRMLDMGFHEDIMLVIDETPRNRQTLMFSATYPDQIKSVSDALQRDPVDVRVDSPSQHNKIKQHFFEINKGERTKTLIAILQHYRPESSLVFCNRKQQCQELADDLWQQGFHALALHGDLEQNERDQVLAQFSNNSSSILIATDVAARGLDIKELAAVINFELSHDSEVHLHRIGRTGRAGKSGLAISLFMASEQFRVDAICRYLGEDFQATSMATLKPREGYKQVPPMVERSVAKLALKILGEGKIKGRRFRLRRLR